MDKKAVVVAGEAPESDEDTLDIKTGLTFKCLPDASGTIISGEATESDDDGGSLSSASIAIDATTCPYINVKSMNDKKFIKYNSLLHKKLHDCNESLRGNILRLTDNTITTGIQELTGINKQLLKSELTVQEAACQLRNASARWNEASSILFQIIDGNFLNTIKT
ncbi:uncharacterized protein [Fopius arisanus]|uniref:Biogenesis of lysosome-related organelles complex 1 subunit 3 n=1 Tax=Fopius arisanus TaxID=64838 RepID=A0A9R1T4R4_9HYME|nr:PREDICTED: uncharacterized protein LOC105266314 [Fopius arisanus]XP_011302661.1 PREDICTED: uncharacterized protein LOC105266314 [Fopius arisanus]XP_011302662.1 PREDICTED: uncharacterized protein LOC105266314 [Fopius arisanus]